MLNALLRSSTAFALAAALFVTSIGASSTSKRGTHSELIKRGAPPPRHLIICVDGIGFSLIEKMFAEGNFREFRAPGRMIAPFPTLTNISMTEIMHPLGVPPANGYEDSFYDIERNRMRGTLLDRFRRKSFIQDSFRELFDYHPSAIKSGLGYAAPPLSTYLEALSDLLRLKQKFNGSSQPTFYAYLGATDSLAHLGGERLVKSYLRRLDSTLANLRREHGASLTITVFSDHGNHFRSYRRVKLQNALRASGFTPDKRLRGNRSVVLPQFGLIGCAVLFTEEDNERAVAEAVRSIEGVDFVSYERDGIVYVLGEGSAATIERAGTRYRYREQRGDSLDLIPIVRSLRNDDRSSADFIEDAAWFAATQNSMRPDAVRRIYDGATTHTRNRAGVIVSFKEGYYSGSRTLDIFAFLQATHGSLGREQSLGFVFSATRPMPAYIRATDLWSVIGSPTLNKSERIEILKTGEMR